MYDGDMIAKYTGEEKSKCCGMLFIKWYEEHNALSGESYQNW